MKSCAFFCLLLLIIGTESNPAAAQSRVVFSIDLREQMRDSVFIPGVHTVELTGDQRPFTPYHTLKLEDKPPADSIYVKEVSFPSRVMGEVLKYNFLIRSAYEVTEERRSRLLPLQPGNHKVHVAYFNIFNW